MASHTVVTSTLNPVSSFDFMTVLKTPNDLLFGACLLCDSRRVLEILLGNRTISCKS